MAELELPGMPKANPPRKGSAAWRRAELNRIFELGEKHGGLTTVWVAQMVLGLCRQRVYQLMADGRLQSVEILGKKFIACDDLLAFAELERPTGVRWEDRIAA
jgi:hypothetical protein